MKKFVFGSTLTLALAQVALASTESAADKIAAMPLMKYGSFVAPAATSSVESGGEAPASTYREVSVGYWDSTGGVDWAINNESYEGGDPSSRLDWRDIPLKTMTISGKWFSVNAEQRESFTYASIELGRGDGGNLQDRDWYSAEYAALLGGPTLWSHVQSAVRDGKALGGSVGLGKRLRPDLLGVDRLDLYTGVDAHYEAYKAYGVEVLADPYGVYPTVPSQPLYLSSSHIMSMSTIKVSWDIGADARLPIAYGFALHGGVKVAPVSGMYSRDKHVLRDDIYGPMDMYSLGFGYGAQIALGYAFSDAVDIRIGYRIDGYRMYVGRLISKAAADNYEETNYVMTQHEYERTGAFASATIKF